MSDILHAHGLWMMPNVYPGAAVEGTDCRLVVSPRGTLSQAALSISPARKKMFWELLQQRVLEKADLLHATSHEEVVNIRTAGLRNPIAVIPNGIVPPSSSATNGVKRGPEVLFLGRLHPIKGLRSLLFAWARIQDHFPQWNLVIAGPGQPSYVNYLEGLIKNNGLKRVRLAGPVYGDQKSALYRRASLFVLPSKSENFALSVAEALAHGLPVLVSKGTPWEEVETVGCGWWIDQGTDSLEVGLRNALGTDVDELLAMGRRGQDHVRSQYSWERVSHMMQQSYGWLMGHSKQPPWVVTTG